MDSRMVIRSSLRRLGILFVISLAAVWLGSELAFYILKDPSERAPQEVELVIPQGTAARIEAGEAITSIPDEIVFVLGDTLVVKNNDDVDHQLGPVWIPARSSASLLMEVPERLAYTCSFQPSQYLGLVVKQPTTWMTRLIAIGLAVPATTAILFVYSIVIRPIRTNVDLNEFVELDTTQRLNQP
jgi:hypothetical protein